MTIRIVARAVARPPSRQALQDALAASIGPTRSEPGCLRYELMQSTTDPNEYVMLEEWRSEADVAGHMHTPHVRLLLEQVSALVSTPPEISSYRVVDGVAPGP